jgi:hypothetical protein
MPPTIDIKYLVLLDQIFRPVQLSGMGAGGAGGEIAIAPIPA